MSPGTYAIQIAELDDAARRLAALSDSVRAGGAEVSSCVRVMTGAATGSALAERLPGLDLGHLSDVLAARCRAAATRVADAAQTYRAMDEALRQAMEPAARTAFVPR